MKKRSPAHHVFEQNFVSRVSERVRKGKGKGVVIGFDLTQIAMDGDDMDASGGAAGALRLPRNLPNGGARSAGTAERKTGRATPLTSRPITHCTPVTRVPVYKLAASSSWA